MDNLDKKRNDKVYEIIIVLKIIYIILSLIAVMSFYVFPENPSQAIVSLITFSIILLIILAYFTWVAIYTKNRIDNEPKFADFVETAILLIVFILVISIVEIPKMINIVEIPEVIKSDYKLLSIFIVLVGAIQFGRKYSIGVATFSSISILLIDFIKTHGDKQVLSIYFERDLVLISALFVISMILGMYVDTERQHSKELTDLANKDELTGLYNHRYFQEYLSKSMTEAEKNNGRVSLLFMDIDYFKNYNDINGHQAGDLLLKEIGTILKKCMRENDVVARYGGEEFAAILRDTSEEEAIEVGEAIRCTIQNNNFEGQENQPHKNITISIGVSTYPSKAANKHQLINTADDALYRAKSFNKNRVECYQSVLDDVCKEMNIKEDTIKSLKTFINMINIKDRYTYGHTERVVIYTRWFAEYLDIKEEDKLKIQIASYLHDIGKLEIPEEVLNKKERLTNEEFQMFRNHPQAGVDLIKNIQPFETFVPIIKHHHERFDGRGYPDGLKGEEIPYLARMITIADSFDAMTSNRPYNVRKTHEEAIEELRNNSGTQFDPVLVEEFISMLLKNKKYI